MSIAGNNRDNSDRDSLYLPGIRRVDVVSGGGSPATTPTITTLVAVAANTEYSSAFGANTKAFRVQHRSGGKILMAFTAGQSGSTYITLWPGTYIYEGAINVTGLVLYFQSPVAGSVVELLSWT